MTLLRDIIAFPFLAVAAASALVGFWLASDKMQYRIGKLLHEAHEEAMRKTLAEASDAALATFRGKASA